MAPHSSPLHTANSSPMASTSHRPNPLSGAIDRLHHLVASFKPVVFALLSFPKPTNATLLGHATAAGFLLVLGYDYVLMRRDWGVLYMSKIDIGLTFPDYFTAMMRSKIGFTSARRDILLARRKVKGEEVVRMGIVDSAAHDIEEKRR